MSEQFPVRKFVAPEIILGNGSRNLVGQYAKTLHGRNVFLVSDPGVIKAGWTGEVRDELESQGLQLVLFDSVSSNPRTSEVAKGSQKYQENECDLLVAVGGGSPMDCAKAIGAVVTNSCHVLDLEGVDEVAVPGPPMICIPTTAGSSADVSQFAIISDENKMRKFSIISKAMVPDVSLIDPEVTLTMSPNLTAETGIDALSHAFESYVSNASSYMTDMYALEATKMIARYLPLAYEEPGELRHREKVMLGSMYAGLAFSNASLGLVHSMAHSLGGYLDYPHGECNAKLLEVVVAFNYSAVRDRYSALEAAMDRKGSDGTGGLESILSRLRELIDRLDIDTGLSKMGVKEENIPYLTENAFNDACHVTNPRPVHREDIARLFHGAL
ncbi:MAG: iron-containing alcohol dehydrogenase [Methanomassiliicoccus sp.]|nr:iron-containing alcohol dehydrogenase [Methanomassiliicoccus sp.]